MIELWLHACTHLSKLEELCTKNLLYVNDILKNYKKLDYFILLLRTFQLILFMPHSLLEGLIVLAPVDIFFL